ncbi:hypothetical protein D2N39_13530 [Gemmobacter lutimaris]|uniref:Uncharacterized protein n=1 Tax=Gemmobacter lutimaris TaxID=2306023 RepID=A0A398BKM8_9RHOB|nr:hypothetical protein [Gemmobacter lutimaris]RID91269.1 hypothetical protein D2N39_13530 [Gemmobacter lutimaris]
MGIEAILAAIAGGTALLFLAFARLGWKAAVAAAGAALWLVLALVMTGNRTDVFEPNLAAAAALALPLVLGYLLLRLVYPRLKGRDRAPVVPLLSGLILVVALIAAGSLWRTADWWLGLTDAPVARSTADVLALLEGPRGAYVNGFLLEGRIAPLPAPGAVPAEVIRLPCDNRGGGVPLGNANVKSRLPGLVQLELADGPSALLHLPQKSRDYGDLPPLEDGFGGCGLSGGSLATIWYEQPGSASRGDTVLASAVSPRLVEAGTATEFKAQTLPQMQMLARAFLALAAAGAVLALIQAALAVPHWLRLRRAG